MIRCLIVDDEPIALRIVEAHLAGIPDILVVAACANAMEALHILRREPVDLLFLDIEMPGLSGIGLIGALERPPHIIFTTAHRSYAFQGFELSAVDYLLKPISLPRLLRALEKYRRLSSTEQSDLPEEINKSPGQMLSLRVDRRTVRIDLDEIRYIESLSDYVVVHTSTRTYTSKCRIRDLDRQLGAFGFVRIHRSFIVSTRFVDAFTMSEVQVGTVSLPISRNYRSSVRKRLQNGVQ